MSRCAELFQQFMTKEFLQGLLYDLLNHDIKGFNFVKATKLKTNFENRSLLIATDGVRSHLRHVIKYAHFNPETKSFSYIGHNGDNYRFPIGYETDAAGNDILDGNGNKISVYKDPRADYWKSQGNGWVSYREQFNYYQEYCNRNKLDIKHLKMSTYKKEFESLFKGAGHTLTSHKRSVEGYDYPSWDKFVSIVSQILGDDD